MKKSCGKNKHKMPGGKCMKGKTHAEAMRKKTMKKARKKY